MQTKVRICMVVILLIYIQTLIPEFLFPVHHYMRLAIFFQWLDLLVFPVSSISLQLNMGYSEQQKCYWLLSPQYQHVVVLYKILLIVIFSLSSSLSWKLNVSTFTYEKLKKKMLPVVNLPTPSFVFIWNGPCPFFSSD